MDRIVGQEQEWKARTHCGLEGPPVLTQGVGEGRGAGFPSPVAAGGQVSNCYTHLWVSSLPREVPGRVNRKGFYLLWVSPRLRSGSEDTVAGQWLSPGLPDL